MKYLVAVDFDGTIVESAFPAIGRDLGGLPWLQELKCIGCELVLWTCRSREKLDEAVQWLYGNGYGDIFSAVNSRAPSNTWAVPGADPAVPDDPRKIFAHLYIDDCVLGAPMQSPALEGSGLPSYFDWEVAGPMAIKYAERTMARWAAEGPGSHEAPGHETCKE